MSQYNYTNAQGEEPKAYAYAFYDPNGEKFLWVKNIAQGIEHLAQLVKSVDYPSRPAIIRKVRLTRFARHPRNKIRGGPVQPLMPTEMQVIDALKSFTNPLGSDPMYKPRFTDYISHHYIETTNIHNSQRWDSVSWWKLYNLGSAFAVLTEESVWNRSISQFKPPVCFIARYVAQLAATIHFMAHAGPRPIYHCDLHMNNVFAEYAEGEILPDFIVGDFGVAKELDLSVRPDPNARARTNLSPAQEIARLSEHVGSMGRMAFGYGKWKHDEDQQWDEHRQPKQFHVERLARSLRKAINRTMDDWRSGKSEKPCDLRFVIHQAKEIENLFLDPDSHLCELRTREYQLLMKRVQMTANKFVNVKPHVFIGTEKDALILRDQTRVKYVNGRTIVMPMLLHGPWYLVTGSDWHPVDGRPHTRPADLETVGNWEDCDRSLSIEALGKNFRRQDDFLPEFDPSTTGRPRLNGPPTYSDDPANRGTDAPGHPLNPLDAIALGENNCEFPYWKPGEGGKVDIFLPKTRTPQKQGRYGGYRDDTDDLSDSATDEDDQEGPGHGEEDDAYEKALGEWCVQWDLYQRQYVDRQKKAKNLRDDLADAMGDEMFSTTKDKEGKKVDKGKGVDRGPGDLNEGFGRFSIS
ncbi:hypothetical protein OQA88_5787 [Cercophora sp. LCS_1]